MKPCEASFSISAVERDTGLSKDTLRVWEKRYGFPVPLRDHNGDRLYPLHQVEKLRVIRRLLDQGQRPSKVVGVELSELLAQLQPEGEASAAIPAAAGDCAPSPAPDLSAFLELVRLHRSADLRACLQQSILKQGLQRFVSETLPLLNHAVGAGWVRGEIEVAEEHLYTEHVQNVLRSAIGSQGIWVGGLANAAAGAVTDAAANAVANAAANVALGGSGASWVGRPRVLLTTFPEELHQLGLLMVEAMLVPEGALCVSLGVQTPIPDIAAAAVSGEFDIVALSFSGAFPLRQACEGLLELRALLPAEMGLWAGGAAVRGRQRKLEGVQVIEDVAQVTEVLSHWRAAHAS